MELIMSHPVGQLGNHKSKKHLYCNLISFLNKWLIKGHIQTIWVNEARINPAHCLIGFDAYQAKHEVTHGK